jgi:cellulose synthase/poly-beta-1,6-N-acetylglucosamine synthase-like glycosyltransferase
MTTLDTILTAYFFLTIAYFVGVNLSYMISLVVSYQEIMGYTVKEWVHNYRVVNQSELAPPVSVIVPAYNEQLGVVDSVRSLLKLSYQKFEVVVVNDGSKDRTLEALSEAFKLRPAKSLYRPLVPTQRVRGMYRSMEPAHQNLVIVDKDNGGKGDALNAGINVAKHEYVCCIDADSILEQDALQKVMRPFLDDERVVAVGGIVRVVNGCEVSGGRVKRVGLSRAMLPVIQVVEYFRAFLLGRMVWQSYNALLIISGAFGMFRRQAVLEVGGYRTDTVGEDLEITMHMHHHFRRKKYPYRIIFVPDPVCWTEVPERVRDLSRQRNRWHRGLLESLLRHRTMFLNPRYGVLGIFAMPYFVFVELFGPVIELLGFVAMGYLLGTGVISIGMATLFLVVSLYYGIMYSFGAVILEEISFQRYPGARHLLRFISSAFFENLGYRQILLVVRFKAFWDVLWRRKGWGVIRRKGLQAAHKG